MITVNGKNLDGYDGKALSELITALGYKPEYIAVEINGEIAKRAQFPSTAIADGDKLEIVCFVGGG